MRPVLSRAFRSAIKLYRRVNLYSVKNEGIPEILPFIREPTSFEIMVVGHIGLTIQRAASLSSFKVQDHALSSNALKIISDALEFQDAGCVALILEVIPCNKAKYLQDKASGLEGAK
ncbi:ketopantoate hydroxymethyltransferase [Phakopsora pachyrhizi]|uniref:3-methyl-2-oxobutanoate hydroxymethyltransferase n=1 Tax=Phakopsora pachyrhizi TaxID=170000 RepID=A0AAV0AHN0_PHAPC|nr:ketopantoate hydroxymethyltransferase [Phakopsora pachyrhizi]